jgi:predicted hydrocarbon binding protein
VVSVEGQWLWAVTWCSECWKRELNMPVCFFTLGMLDRLVNSGPEKRYTVTEEECFAVGHSRCAFAIKPVGSSV